MTTSAVSEPRTEASERLADFLCSLFPAEAARHIRPSLALIEAEARAALLAEVRAKVDALWVRDSISYDKMTRGGALQDVLALLSEDPA